MNYPVVWPLHFTFKEFSAKFPDVRKFRNFTVLLNSQDDRVTEGVTVFMEVTDETWTFFTPDNGD